MRRCVLVALVVLGAVGCSSRGDVSKAEHDLGALRGELAALREHHERLARETAQVLLDLKAAEDSVERLRAGLGDTTGELSRLRARVEGAEAAVRETRAALETRPATAAPTSVAAREAAARAAGPEAAYAAALATFRAREHGQAVLEFLDFIGKHPRHPLAANAQYWIGEAYYLQHDYRQALVEFEKVLTSANGGDNVPDALLRIGLTHLHLREPARAREAWQRVVREYPDSDAAARARMLLQARR
jgi:tol-pal system protein YbgF